MKDIREYLRPWPTECPGLHFDENFFRRHIPADASMVVLVGDPFRVTAKFLADVCPDAIIFVAIEFEDAQCRQIYMREHWDLRHRLIPVDEDVLLTMVTLLMKPEVVFIEKTGSLMAVLSPYIKKSLVCGVKMTKEIDWEISSAGGHRASYDNSRKGWVLKPCRH